MYILLGVLQCKYTVKITTIRQGSQRAVCMWEYIIWTLFNYCVLFHFSQNKKVQKFFDSKWGYNKNARFKFLIKHCFLYKADIRKLNMK